MSTDEQRGKRRADVQLTKDTADASGEDEHVAGGDGITRAREDILAARKRVTVKRSTAPVSAPKASNPFAGISLTAPASSQAAAVAAPTTTTTTTTTTTAAGTAGTLPAGATEKPAEAAEKSTPQTAEENTANTDTNPPTTSGGFGGLANSTGGFGGFGGGGGFGGFGGFGGLATTSNGAKSGFGGLAFGASAPLAFGDPAKANPVADSETAANGAKDDAPSVFGAQPSSKKEEQVVAQQTGEEDEETVLSCPASLFEFVEDKENGKREWRTRGSGEFKLNKDKETGQKGRLIMRQRGIGKLLLNANVYKNMTVSVMADGNGISFSCVNCVGADGADGSVADQGRLSMFAVKLGKDTKDQVQELANAIKEFV